MVSKWLTAQSRAAASIKPSGNSTSRSIWGFNSSQFAYGGWMRFALQNKRPLVGHQMAFLTIIGFWVFRAVIISLRSSVLDFPAQDELALRRVIVTVIGIALTWLLYLVLRAFDRQPLSLRVASAFVAAVPCAFAIAYCNYFVFNVYDPISLFADKPVVGNITPTTEHRGLTPQQEIAEIAITNYFFLIAWASLYLALGYAREVREAERTASRFAQAAQDSELRSLRYQVNPHFLFNTLNSLSSLVIKGDRDKAEAMIQNLSTFYRTSLSSDPLEDVTVAEEVELQKQYLDIEKVRFPERLRTIIDIPPDLADERIPALILQPLVENAIKYGVSRTTRPVTLRIAASQRDGWLDLMVEDDGELSPATNDHGSGIGLANVRDRLEARYGATAKLTTEQKQGGGFRASIAIPIVPEDFA
jgi:two-component system, LytTR family, sensor kinase